MQATDLSTPNPIQTATFPDILTGLHGYQEGVKEGRTLVFNLEEMNFAELCTAGSGKSNGSTAMVTGLSGYVEGVKQGRVLVFNLEEMTCMDLCSSTQG